MAPPVLPPSRFYNVVSGIACMVAGVAGIFSVMMDRYHPGALHSLHPTANGRHGLPMPPWMALEASILFEIVGLALLTAQKVNPRPSPAARVLAALVTAYFLAFFDSMCIYAVAIGAKWINFFFLPNLINSILNWVIWSPFVIGLTAGVIVLLVRIIKLLFMSPDLP